MFIGKRSFPYPYSRVRLFNTNKALRFYRIIQSLYKSFFQKLYLRIML
jgi:hypothetical protein